MTTPTAATPSATATSADSAESPLSSLAGAPTEGPVGRLTLVPLATGLVAAALTTFVVLPSASEARIVGAALVAFGAGWAVLAALTGRFTTRPQRWAYVPAAVLLLGGAGLALVDPGEPALTRLTWGWAPGLVVLGVWIGRRAHRAAPRRARLLVYPVAVVMVAAGLGGLLQSVGSDPRTAAGPMPGQLFDVGGYRLHLHCTGSGAPTVVLLNGLGETSPQWVRILSGVAPSARVCAYDRAGQGWSEDSPNPADATAAATDLHELLNAAGETGPYVLVGHSSGGLHALTFTHLYPTQVSGVVLLDSASPDQRTLIPSFDLEYQVMRRVLAAAPTLFRFGLGRLTGSASAPALPGDAGRQAAAFANSPRGFAGTRAEQAALPTSFAEAAALTTLGSRPLVVLTAKDNVDHRPGWAAAQDRLAALSPDSRHTVADVDHVGLLHDPAGAALSVTAVHDVLAAVRSAGPAPASTSRS